VGAHQLWLIILAGRPRLIDLAHTATQAAGGSLMNEQRKQEVEYGAYDW
jgi:hypothetical protein